MDFEPMSLITQESSYKAEDFVVVAEPKPKDTRGFIYVVYDPCYPDLFKVGRTIDLVKRLQAYNVDRPYEDVVPVICTHQLMNCYYVEKRIKEELSRKHSSAGKSKEWFDITGLDIVYKVLEELNLSYKEFNDMEN